MVTGGLALLLILVAALLLGRRDRLITEQRAQAEGVRAAAEAFAGEHLPRLVEQLRAGDSAETVLHRMPPVHDPANAALLRAVAEEISAAERRRAAAMAAAVSPAHAQEHVYPEHNWARLASPAEQGWSTEGLLRARAYSDSIATAAVMIVHRGVVVDEWGETMRKFNVHSVRKSLTEYGDKVDASVKSDIEQGVSDLREALKWYRRAAEQGNALGRLEPQFRVGIIEPGHQQLDCLVCLLLQLLRLVEDVLRVGQLFIHFLLFLFQLCLGFLGFLLCLLRLLLLFL